MENRLGDNAEMALIELVDYNTIYGNDVVKVEKKSTRRRGGSGKAKTADTAPAASAAVTPADDAVVIETPATQTPKAEDTTAAEPEAPAANEENAEKGE